MGVVDPVLAVGASTRVSFFRASKSSSAASLPNLASRRSLLDAECRVGPDLRERFVDVTGHRTSPPPFGVPASSA